MRIEESSERERLGEGEAWRLEKGRSWFDPFRIMHVVVYRATSTTTS